MGCLKLFFSRFFQTIYTYHGVVCSVKLREKKTRKKNVKEEREFAEGRGMPARSGLLCLVKIKTFFGPKF